MADVDLDALEQVLSWVPESAEQLKKCQYYEIGDEQAPFMSEAWLYNLLGKDDARSFLCRMNALIAELRRLRGQAAYPWTCRTCLTTQPVEDGVVCNFVCESCRREFERLRGQTPTPYERVASDVLTEIKRAVAKFPTWPTDPLHAVAVVGEECGELTKAVLQSVYEPHKATLADVRAEAVQTAAMAIRFLVSLDAGAYREATPEQHAQDGCRVYKPKGV